MKKMLAILAVLMLLGVSTVFAADGTESNSAAGQPLQLSGKEIAVSPGVRVNYAVLDNNQFYIIGAYHGGGDYLYGSSSTVTKIYKYKWLTSDAKGFTKIPTTKANAQSEDQWTNAGFED